MTCRLCASLRRLVVSAFLLLLVGIGCQKPGTKSKELVSVDLTRLQLLQTDKAIPAQISLKPLKSVDSLPESVRSRIPEMSNPGGRFDAGDVSGFDTPRRRLVFGGISDRYCLVHYEFGGIAYGHRTALFEISGNQSIPLWAHAGGSYTSLDQFAAETDRHELTNQVGETVW